MSSFFRSSKSARQDESKSATSSSQPWIEKYRPRTIDQVTSQRQVVQVLQRTIESKNLPHLLFYGPPGTGKTSTVLALAKDLFGTAHYKSRILELNASDERGINVIREKVKTFARAIVSDGQSEESAQMPPYKIIILDEADSMTPDAQAALRRVIENHSKITRFCLICNYVTRIISPLASRCAKFRFTSLDASDVRTRLTDIANAENVVLSEDALDTIVDISQGDLRRAIMLLQSSSRLVGMTRPITADVIFEIGGVVPPAIIQRFVELWHQDSPASFENIQSAVDDIAAEGYAASQILLQLYTSLLKDQFMTSIQKAKIARVFGNVDHYLVHGADEYLQLTNLMLECTRIVTI